MIDLAEIQRSFRGAWRIALGDFRGMEEFDVSAAGFWRSFQAIILMIPADLLVLAAYARFAEEEGESAAEPFSAGALVLEEVWSILGWIAFPLLLFFAARQLGIADRYAPFVVARNWGGALATLPFAAVSGLYLIGLLNGAIASLALLVVMLVVIRYLYLLARASLGAPPLFCGAIVAADILVGLLVTSGFGTLFAS